MHIFVFGNKLWYVHVNFLKLGYGMCTFSFWNEFMVWHL
jgi:hypothetical protein